MSDNKEKLKALQLTLDKLDKAYGKGTVMKLSDERVIDVPAIWIDADLDDFRTQFPQDLRRDPVAGTVCTVHDNAQPVQAQVAWQCALGIFDVSLLGTLDPCRPADTIGISK